MTSTTVRSPSGPVRFVRGWWALQPVIIPALALVLAFVVGAVLMLLVGVNPLEAYWALLRGMYGTPTRLAGSVAKSVPFVGSALALAWALRAGLFNIGAQGQLLVGGITAAWVGTWSFMFDLPGIVAVPIVILAGFVGGAAWGWHPGRPAGPHRRPRGDLDDHAEQHRPARHDVGGELQRSGRAA